MLNGLQVTTATNRKPIFPQWCLRSSRWN